MGDQLKPDTSEKMRALCKKISVAHNLDAEIQEELYAHMEDKLLAYMNGDETLAEEDAFLLVREHFGDPSRVKALFQGVHRYETNVSLFRRLAAAMIVTMAVTVICYSLVIVGMLLWPSTWNSGVFRALLAVGSVLAIVFSWLLLWRYQRRLDMGHTPWFLTWHPAYFAGSITALLALQWLLQLSLLLVEARSLSKSMWPQGFLNLLRISIAISPVFICMAWLWWCDRPPRQARAVGTAAGCWIIWAFSLAAITHIKDLVRTLVDMASLIYRAQNSHTAYYSYNINLSGIARHIATSSASSFAHVVAYALIACMLYKAGQYTLSHTLGKRP